MSYLVELIIFLNKIMSVNSQYASRPISMGGTAEKRKSLDVSNKVFFSNIKAELNSIRTDVNKLVSNKDPSAKWTGISKSISLREPPKEQSQPQDPEALQSSDKANQPNKLAQQNIMLNRMQEQLNSKSQENQWLKKKIEEYKNDKEEREKIIAKLQRQCERSVQSFGQEKVIQLHNKIQQQNNEIQTKKCELRALNQLLAKLHRTADDSNRRHEEQVESVRRGYEEKLNNLSRIHDNQMSKMRRIHQQQIINMSQKEEEKIKALLKEQERKLSAEQRNSQDNQSRSQAMSYKQLGADFERKINELVDENYSLKNRIANLQSQLENDKVHKQSLQETIEAYEQRDRDAANGALASEVEEMRTQIQKLQSENDKMQSDHQYEIMKLENIIDELKDSSSQKNQGNGSINQILKDQITEIQSLRQKLREKTELIAKLKK